MVTELERETIKEWTDITTGAKRWLITVNLKLTGLDSEEMRKLHATNTEKLQSVRLDIPAETPKNRIRALVLLEHSKMLRQVAELLSTEGPS